MCRIDMAQQDDDTLLIVKYLNGKTHVVWYQTSWWRKLLAGIVPFYREYEFVVDGNPFNL